MQHPCPITFPRKIILQHGFLVSIDFHKLPSDVKVAFYCFIFTHRSMFFFVITIFFCKNTGFYGVFSSLLVSMLQKHWYMFLSKKHHHFFVKKTYYYGICQKPIVYAPKHLYEINRNNQSFGLLETVKTQPAMWHQITIRCFVSSLRIPGATAISTAGPLRAHVSI